MYVNEWTDGRHWLGVCVCVCVCVCTVAWIWTAAGADVKQREAAVQKLAAKLVEAKDAARLRQLLADLRPSFASIPKAKTAKMVRQLLDSLAAIPGTTDMQLEVCKEQVWKPYTEQIWHSRCRHEASMPRTHLFYGGGRRERKGVGGRVSSFSHTAQSRPASCSLSSDPQRCHLHDA